MHAPSKYIPMFQTGLDVRGGKIKVDFVKNREKRRLIFCSGNKGLGGKGGPERPLQKTKGRTRERFLKKILGLME